MKRAIARGFSLIEVMVSATVLAVGLAAAVPLITFTVTNVSQARKTTDAQLLASETLERLRLEHRFDPEPVAETRPLATELWSAPRLPHATTTGALGPVGQCAEDETCCNPGADDGIDYNVAFPVRREGNEYLLCYDLAIADGFDHHGNAIPGVGQANVVSVEALVKVLWRTPTGNWTSRSTTGLLSVAIPVAGGGGP